MIYLDENTGSAGGYKRGLEEAMKCGECEYILLLDDDNVIDKNYSNVILTYHKFYESECGKGKVALFFNRINLRLEPSNTNLGSFLGFDIFDLPYRIKKQ